MSGQTPATPPPEGRELLIIPAASLASGLEWLARVLRGRTEGPVQGWTTVEAPLLASTGQPTGKKVRVELQVFAQAMGPRRGARIAIFNGEAGETT